MCTRVRVFFPTIPYQCLAKVCAVVFLESVLNDSCAQVLPAREKKHLELDVIEVERRCFLSLIERPSPSTLSFVRFVKLIHLVVFLLRREAASVASQPLVVDPPLELVDAP